MIIDNRNRSELCACGLPHHVATQFAHIEAGCMQNLHAHLSDVGLSGHTTAIYDTNTYQAKGLIRPLVDHEIILDAANLHADDVAIATVMHQLSANAAVLIAVGGGTIHDIVRYCAYKRRLPYVSCPTSASSDGYCASGCTVTWRGAQVLLPGTAPAFVLADLDVVSQAPVALARAGVGEAVSKYTALADWKIANLATGRPSCPVAESMLWQSAIAAQGACLGLADGKAGAFAQLMYAHLLSGMATQLLADTQAGSAAEHLLARLIETSTAPGTAGQSLLHGERVGLCAAEIADLYHSVVQAEDIAPQLKAYTPPDAAWMAQQFGPALGDLLLDANTPDCLLSVDPAQLVRQWGEIRRVVAEIPDGNSIRAMLSSVGITDTTTEALGITAAKRSRMLRAAGYVRNQLTLARMLRMLKFRYSSNDFASRAPSRRSRYADKAITRPGKSSAVSGSTMR